MRFKIRDWDSYFEADRSRQWKSLKWVPIPNKQGSGYRRIMSEKNGLDIFACWIAIIELASLCNPRGDLTKYDISDLSRLTLIDSKKLDIAITYLSQVLDWIEVIKNIDTNVKILQNNVCDHASGSSMLCSSVLCNSLEELEKPFLKTWRDDFLIYEKMVSDEFDALIADNNWIMERKKYHPALDIKLSMEKAFNDFWGIEAGWNHKKKSRCKEIDWNATFKNALTLKANQVYAQKPMQ